MTEHVTVTVRQMMSIYYFVSFVIITYFVYL